ncbi:site-specific integrase [Enterococcus faecalis]|nr:site-specific integrase [Enterococcus faecalis]EHB4976905.1 site-specific integrase [Enterococcus faecalis]
MVQQYSKLIKEYTKKDGSKAYKFQTYLGTDPLTGKKKFTTRRGFKTKKEADLALSRLKIEIAEKGLSSRKLNNQYSFKDVYDLWKESYERTVTPNTFIRVESLFKKQILPTFGSLRIEHIKPAYCQKVVNDWYEKYATFGALKAYTTKVFNYAQKLEILDSNPMIIIDTPRKKYSTDKIKFYEKDILIKFLETVEKTQPYHVFTFFRLVSFSGLRKGEMLALTWDNIDFSKSEIHVKRTITKNSNGELILGLTPKTKASVRTLSIDEKTMLVLKKWYMLQKEEFFKRGVSLQKEQLVFSTEKNGIVALTTPNRWLEKICKEYHFEDIKIHGFRHTHCSLLFESAMEQSQNGDISQWLKVIQERMGHAKIQTTLNIYNHVTKKAQQNFEKQFANFATF